MNLYDELTQPCVADRVLGAIRIRLRRGDSLAQIEDDAHRWYAEALASGDQALLEASDATLAAVARL